MATRIHPVASELLAVYKQSADHFLAAKGAISRIKSLRPSQLPFCPVGFFVQHATHGAIRTMDMRGSFYTEIGTSIHKVVQTYLSHSGRFLANWKCRQCGKVYKVSVQHECCDFVMDYEEIEIDYKGVVGHIDAVFRDRMGYYHVVDFKTTSVLGAPRKLKDPGVAYIEQVEAYWLYLWRQHGIKCKSVILMFIRRDNPKEPVVWTREINRERYLIINERMKTYQKMHHEVLSVKTLAEALALARHGRCANPYCKSCKLLVSQKKQLRQAFERGAARLPLIELS